MEVRQATADQSFACQKVGLGKGPNNALEQIKELSGCYFEPLLCPRVVVANCLSGRPLFHGLHSLACDGRTRARETAEAAWLTWGLVTCAVVAAGEMRVGAQGNTTSERRSLAEEVVKGSEDARRDVFVGPRRLAASPACGAGVPCFLEPTETSSSTPCSRQSSA